MSVNFYNNSLKKWKENHHTDDDLKMEKIFRSGMISSGDALEQSKSQFYGTLSPQNEAKSAMISGISEFDLKGHSSRLLFQNRAQTKCITLDILDEAFEAPSLEISKLNKTEIESIGPIIPVRYTYANVENDSVDKKELYDTFMKSFNDLSLANQMIFDNEMVSLRVEDEAIEIILKWLESATKNLAIECLHTFNRSELCHGKFIMSYLYIIETVHSIKASAISALNSNCANPDCKKGSISSVKVCSVCRTPYCSRECQKSDW